MGKIKSFQDLKNKKAELKEEIREIETILSFENPRKSFGVITEGLTEKYLGNFMDSGITQNVYSLTERFLLPSLKISSARFLGNIIYKKLKPSTGKTLLGVGAVILTSIAIKKVIQEFDDYQQKETAKSIGKLI